MSQTILAWVMLHGLVVGPVVLVALLTLVAGIKHYTYRSIWEQSTGGTKPRMTDEYVKWLAMIERNRS